MNLSNNIIRIINILLTIILLIIILSRCKNDYIYKKMDYDKNNNQCECKSPYEGDIIALDDNGNFIYQNSLDIFNNNSQKIAPGMFGIYYFKVYNLSNIDIKYHINYKDLNNYNIDLKYRLKRNGEYMIDNKWKNINELSTSLIYLKQGKSDNYSLEWKWFDNDDVDSYIGENMISKYLINISINLEQGGKI